MLFLVILDRMRFVFLPATRQNLFPMQYLWYSTAKKHVFHRITKHKKKNATKSNVK